MSVTRRRRLDGLARLERATTVPPPVPETDTEPRPGRPAREAEAERAAPDSATPAMAAARRAGKHRRAVTVPTALVEQLRHRAHQLDRYHTDLILDCLAATAGALARDRADRVDDRPFARPRRQAHRGRTVTTLTLYLTQDEVEAIDALARQLGLNRSGVVSEALALGLEHTT